MQKSDSPMHVTVAPVLQSASRRIAAIVQQPAIMLPLLTLLALVLRLYKLTYWDYWDDEVISTFAARASPADILFSIADYSVHPPFYYLVLHFWMGLGEDLYTIRLLSVLISARLYSMYVSARTGDFKSFGGTGGSDTDGYCTLSSLSWSAGADVSFVNLAGARNGIFFSTSMAAGHLDTLGWVGPVCHLWPVHPYLFLVFAAWFEPLGCI
jgi:hypothetical protein